MRIVGAHRELGTRVRERVKRAAASTLQAGTPRNALPALAELSRRLDGDVPGRGQRLSLAWFELSVFSQNGEDGVIAEILRRTGTDGGFFVEFGAAVTESNCLLLADVAGWAGLFMDGDADAIAALRSRYLGSENVAVRQAKVTPANVEALFAEGSVPRELDVLSIDIDGLDYHVWEALERYRPRLVVIEYNGAIAPQRRLVQPADVEVWDGSDFFGASIGALDLLAGRKGYRLVYTELSATNAFFVRDDLASEFAQGADVPRRTRAPLAGRADLRGDAAGRSYVDLDA